MTGIKLNLKKVEDSATKKGTRAEFVEIRNLHTNEIRIAKEVELNSKLKELLIREDLWRQKISKSMVKRCGGKH